MSRPAHIAALDAALEVARSMVDVKAKELLEFRKEHYSVLQGEKDISNDLSHAERDRVATEQAIRALGYVVPPRKVSDVER